MKTEDHWNNIYSSQEVNRLGWHEETPLPSIKLLDQCKLQKDDLILNAGAGASTFLDYLLDQGYKNIIATDISEKGLQKLKERLGSERSGIVNWIRDDLTDPTLLKKVKDVSVWHDRAVLHFFTEIKDQDTYFDLVRKTLKSGGYVIIAAFSLTGAKKCSGLDVKNYSSDMLAGKLGPEFSLMDAFDYVYTMPSGEKRDYIYTLFQKKS